MGRGKGREVEEVPLCANCMVEVDLDGLDEGMVVQKAVRRVERGDGGLGRRRWESSEVSSCVLCVACCGELGLTLGQRQREQRMWNRRGAVDIHAEGTVAGDGELGVEGGEFMEGVGDDTIYVSMRDPTGRPAYKPSPTKPIPKWMQPFPSSVDDTCSPNHGDGPVSLLAERLESLKRTKSRSDGSSSNGSTICPPDTGKDDDHTSEEPGLSRLSGSSHSSAYRTQRPTTHRGASFVSVEPLKLPSSHLLERVTQEANQSSSTLNTYHTPPEYPSPSASFRTITPESFSEIDYSGRGADPLHSSKRYTYRIHSVRRPTGAAREDGAQNPLRKLGNMNNTNTPHRSSPQTHRVSHSAVPLTSSEYLERYQPGKAASMSGPSGPRARGHMVAKLRKTGRAEPSAGLVTEETAVADVALRRTRSSNVVDPGQSQRADSNRDTKRRSVQAELRKFFGR